MKKGRMNSSRSTSRVGVIILLLTLVAACTTSANLTGDETQAPAATAAEELPMATATEPPVVTVTEEQLMATATEAPAEALPAEAPTVTTTTEMTATLAPTPTLAAAPTVTATAESSLPALSPGACCLGKDVEPGHYATPGWFKIPLTFEVGAGWRGVHESSTRFYFLTKGENSIGHANHILAFFALPAGTTASEFIADLRSTSMLDTSAPEPVSYGGVTFQALDAVAQPNPEATGNAGREPGSILISAVHQAVAPGITWYTESTEARLRFIVLEVGDQTLFIYIEAPQEGFETFAADAEQVLETLQVEAMQ